MTNEVECRVVGIRKYNYGERLGVKIAVDMPKYENDIENVIGLNIKIYDIPNNSFLFNQMKDLDLNENNFLNAVVLLAPDYRTEKIVFNSIILK